MKRQQLELLRNRHGFIDITQLDGICQRSFIPASNAIYLYELEDCALIYKRYSFDGGLCSLAAFNEVLYSHVLRDIGLFCAEYDFASYGNSGGTVSYIIKGTHNTLYDILAKQCGTYLLDADNSFFTYKRLCTLFNDAYAHCAKTLKRELLSLIVADALMGHGDKSPTNLLLWENDTKDEAHLYSVDASDLWGSFISLEDRGRELFSFLMALPQTEKDPLLKFINDFSIHEQILQIARRYPAYSEIAAEAMRFANRTKEKILTGRNSPVSGIQDYLLYPKRQIRVYKNGKIL